MELQERHLQSFIALYRKEFGKELTMSEAQEKALSLLRFVSLCITPIEKSPKDDSIETAGCK
jgi:hypothetical protein